MLGPPFNTLTADHVYSCHNMQKFPQQVPTLFSSKPKTFSETFIAFWKSPETFEHFTKKDHLHTFNIAEASDSE